MLNLKFPSPPTISVTMSSFVRAIQLSVVLVGMLAILIVLPAVLFDAMQQWQVIFLLHAYAIFFMATIWRAVKYGKLTKTTEDEQYKRTSGRWALVVQFIGLLVVHWLALFEFSRSVALTNPADRTLAGIVGIMAIAVAIIINQVAIRTLKGFFDRIAIKPDHRLVTTGIYSIVRHPIYLSYVLLFAGYCTMLQSFASFMLLGLVCAVWLGNRMAIEEEMLAARFGEDYKAYQQNTKRLFPFIY
ncbi:methyltransferase family protein [Aerosakkonema funiforme]|uniref:methyltransferase family protein n=2 Tax=Aerosakkonema TaxID=1246629 RepID=UPI0035B8C38E